LTKAESGGPGSIPRQGLLLLAAAAAYYLAALLGFALRFPPATTSVLWPPNSLITAVLLLNPPRRWWLYLAAVLPAHLLVELQVGLPLRLVIALYANNCLEALIAAVLVRRWSDAPARFDSLRRATAFLAGAVVLAPFLSSFSDAAVVHWLRGEDYWPVFARRLFSNAISALTVVPCVTMLASQGLAWLRESDLRRRLEAAALTGVLGLIAVVAFTTHREEPSSLPGAPYTSLPFLLPALLWAAVRFGPGGGSLALLGTSLLAIRAATVGWSPFSPLSPEESVVALQVFVTLVGFPLFYLGALIEERRTTTAVLAERLEFEELLSRLSAAFVHLPSHQMDQAFASCLEQLGRFFDVDRVSLRRFSAETSEMPLVYAWTAVGRGMSPSVFRDSEIPWARWRLLREESVVCTDLDDLPAEAARDRDFLRGLGMRSLLLLPLVVGRRVIGGLGLATVQAPKPWPQILVERGRLIADLLASVMARKQAEDALRYSETTKAAVLASLPSQVAVLDRDGRIVTTNDSWASDAMGGVGSDHLAHWRRLAAEGLREGDAVVAGIAGILEGSRPSFVIEHPGPAPPGAWFLTTVVPLRAPEGGAVISLSEVTERKRAELEAQKSRQELAHFLRVSTIGELTTSLAHELNQPLTAILANAQTATRLLADRGGADPEAILEILADIAEEDRRAGEIIRRLRELLRKGEPHRGLLDVNALVREVVELVASDALIRRVGLRMDLDARRLLVLGDRVQVQQVLLNLIINAMEAIAEGSGADPLVLVKTEDVGDGTVRISVADTGPGLRAAAPDRVFEPFYTTKRQGLGMGLSIARSIAEAHGGGIEAANRPDQGARFTVTLPAADPGHRTTTPPPAR
jgi:signal transduction histidine kinase/integral membrane sensor domain MASE1